MVEVTIRESYNYYKREYDNPLPMKVYVSIVNGYMKRLTKYLLDGYDVRLGAKMGVLGIRGRRLTATIGEDGKIKGLPIDWKATMEYWKKYPEKQAEKEYVFHFNEHSDGLTYKMVWFQAKSLFKNKFLYAFKFATGNKRALGRRIKAGQEYLERENYNVYGQGSRVNS